MSRAVVDARKADVAGCAALPSLTASLQAVWLELSIALLGVGNLKPIAFAEGGFGHSEVGIELEGFAGHQDGIVAILGFACVEQVALRLEVVFVGGGWSVPWYFNSPLPPAAAGDGGLSRHVGDNLFRGEGIRGGDGKGAVPSGAPVWALSKNS